MGDISNEPSMEDILASIKRIIAEEPAGDSDQESAKPDRFEEQATMAQAKQAEHKVEPDDVLDLASDQIASDDDIAMSGVQEAVNPEPQKPLLSTASAEASRASLASLSKLIVRQETESSNTLEGLVRDLLKPMIKPWLDENLPGIVERAVAQEVARLAGRDF